MRFALVIWLFAGLAVAGDSRSADEWLKVAQDQSEQDRLADAWETLERAIEAHPGNARLCIALGDVFVRMAVQEQRGGADGSTITSFYLDAERMYDEAIVADPRSSDAVYGKARVNYNLSGTVAGTKKKAATQVSRCLALDPEHGGALALQGHIFYGDRKYAEAARFYGRAIACGDADLTVHVRHGHCAYAQGKKDDAKQAYFAALRRHPTSTVPIRSGLYHLAGKDWRKTVPLLREATEAAPRSPAAWFYLGYGLHVGEDWAPAATAFGKAVALDPSHANAHYYLGLVAEKRGGGDGVFVHYRKALQANPAHAEAAAAFDRRIRAGRRRMPDFMRLFDELLVLAPADPWIRNNYAYALRQTAEMSGAANTAQVPEALVRMLRRSAEVYEAVARMRPDDPQIQSDTGLVYEFYPAIHDDKKASAYFTRALDLTESRYRDALNGLIRLCERSHDWKTLHAYTSDAAAAFAAGERGLYPTEAGEILPTGDLGTRLLRAEVDAALAMAKHHLFHPDAGRKILDPVVRHKVDGDVWAVPKWWRIDRPESKPRGEPVKLVLDLTPGAVHTFKTKVVTTEREGPSQARTRTRIVRAQLTIDSVADGEATATWSSKGDDAVGDGRVVARLDAAGRIRRGSVVAFEVANVTLEPRVAGALHMGVVPLPDRPVRVGETWAVPLEPAMVCDAARSVSDAEVHAEAYQTLVGFETVDGAKCARIEMVYAATIRTNSLRLARHMGLRSGTIHIKGTCVLLHGLDGRMRRITWDKHQRCVFDRANAGVKPPPLPPHLAKLAKMGRVVEIEVRRDSTWETVAND